MSELYHFGVKGMKWGIRKDRKRSVSTRRSKSDSKDYSETRDLLRKSPNKLSNSELRKINERLNLEQQYVNLTTIQKQKGNRFVDKVRGQMTKTLANDVSKQLLDVGKIVVTAGVNYALARAFSHKRGNGPSYSPDFITRQIGR